MDIRDLPDWPLPSNLFLLSRCTGPDVFVPRQEGIGIGLARENAKPLRPLQSRAFAALDLGTNSCRMLIARPNGEGFAVIDAFSKPVYLGKDLLSSGRLNRDGMARTISALQICRKKLIKNDVDYLRLVATQACRQAKNSDHFLNRVTEETGLSLEVISPKEEARLAVIGAASHVANDTEQLLVVDIGGGSTEMVWLDLRGVPPKKRAYAVKSLKIDGDTGSEKTTEGLKIVDWISIPLGVSTLLGKFRDVKDDVEKFALMSWYFEEQLDPFAPTHRSAEVMCPSGFQVIGTSGTVTTIAASHLGLQKYDRSSVDGINLTTEDVERIVQKYLKAGPSGRLRDPCIGRARGPQIMSGAAILQGILRVWPTACLTVADSGLREGILLSQMFEQGVWEPVE